MSLTRFGTFRSTPARTKKIRTKTAGTPIANAHGSHAKKKKRFKGTLVMSTHGSHAQVRHPRQPRSLKESATFTSEKNKQFDDWYDHGNHANEHIDSTPHKVEDKLARDHDITNHPDVFHVTKYTANSFDLNRYLHEKAKRPDDPYRRGDFEEHAEKLDGIAKKHALKTPVHVFHGAGFHPGEEAAKDPEHKIHFAGFLSTSVDPGTAAEFAKDHYVKGPRIKKEDSGQPHFHIIHIHLPKGHHAIVPGGNSLHENEKEVIVGRHTTLKIHPKPTTYSTDAGGFERHYHVWHAHPVPNEETDEKAT